MPALKALKIRYSTPECVHSNFTGDNWMDFPLSQNTDNSKASQNSPIHDTTNLQSLRNRKRKLVNNSISPSDSETNVSKKHCIGKIASSSMKNNELTTASMLDLPPDTLRQRNITPANTANLCQSPIEDFKFSALLVPKSPTKLDYTSLYDWPFSAETESIFINDCLNSRFQSPPHTPSNSSFSPVKSNCVKLDSETSSDSILPTPINDHNQIIKDQSDKQYLELDAPLLNSSNVPRKKLNKDESSQAVPHSQSSDEYNIGGPLTEDELLLTTVIDPVQGQDKTLPSEHDETTRNMNSFEPFNQDDIGAFAQRYNSISAISMSSEDLNEAINLCCSSERDIYRLNKDQYSMKPFVRSAFPREVSFRSPVMGISPIRKLAVCFRIGEVIRAAGKYCGRENDVIFELYARVKSSRRNSNSRQQTFTLCDLFYEKPPYLFATYELWSASNRWNDQSVQFLGDHGYPPMCRCIGRMSNETRSDWTLKLLNISSATWKDVDYVRGIVDT